jgi:hypothetical protein
MMMTMTTQRMPPRKLFPMLVRSDDEGDGAMRSRRCQWQHKNTNRTAGGGCDEDVNSCGGGWTSAAAATSAPGRRRRSARNSCRRGVFEAYNLPSRWLLLDRKIAKNRIETTTTATKPFTAAIVPRRRRRLVHQLVVFAPFVFFLLLLSGAVANAHRLGDAIDTDAVFRGRNWFGGGGGVYSSARVETLVQSSSSVPYFGIHSTTTFAIPDAVATTSTAATTATYFQLQFEDGLWVLPAQPLAVRTRSDSSKNSNPEYLEKIVVEFVYSRSGGGTIHAVSSKASYTSTTPAPAAATFRVEYQWVQERAIYWNAGLSALLFLVLISGVCIVLLSCGVVDPTMTTASSSLLYADDDSDAAAAAAMTMSMLSVTPKWD